MVRLYESDPSDLSVANRIIFDEPPYSRGLNQIKVRQYLGGRVYLNIAAESGDRELILRLGENQDVNFGRFTVNVEFIGADNPGGRAFIVLALRRR